MTSIEPQQPSVWSRHNATTSEEFDQAAKGHAIEPFLLGQKPRRTRTKKGKGNWFFKLFIVPHTLAASFLWMRLLLAIAIVLFGRTVSGHVVAKSAREGKTSTYTVEYSYSVEKRLLQGKNEVPLNEYDMLKRGDTVLVRVLKWLPDADSQIVFPGESRWRSVQSLAFPALLFGGVIGVFIYTLYVAPGVQRRLVANGLPTVARIVSVEEVKGKGTTFKVEYEFAPVEYANAFLANAFRAVPRTLGEEQKLQSQMALSKEDGRNVRAGELVTVLFNANKPARNLIYRFADYEVVA